MTSSSSTRWPTFLGIGVPKAGSTWLYEVLSAHPRIWAPPDEREVHFFDRYYEKRGYSWYRKFFPDKDSSYRAVGEITPHYLYCKPERIAALKSELPSIKRIILLLRNPVDRLHSHYWFRCRIDNLDISFRSFVENHPHGVEWGRYGTYLDRWLDRFDRSQFLILTTEKDLVDVESTRRKLATFLQVDPDAFPPDAGKSKENSRHIPYFRAAYAWAVKVNRELRRRDIYWPRTLARTLGVKNWFGKQEVNDEIDPQLRKELSNLYAEEVKKLEEMLDREFTEWDLSTMEVV